MLVTGRGDIDDEAERCWWALRGVTTKWLGEFSEVASSFESGALH